MATNVEKNDSSIEGSKKNFIERYEKNSKYNLKQLSFSDKQYNDIVFALKKKFRISGISRTENEEKIIYTGLDYDTNFVDSLNKYKKSKNLGEDGVIDFRVLNYLSQETPSIFTEDILNIIKKFDIKRKELHTGTLEQLSGIPKFLFDVKGLEEVGVNYNQAVNYIKKEAKWRSITIDKIKEYKSRNGLPQSRNIEDNNDIDISGIIDKETYFDIISWVILQDLAKNKEDFQVLKRHEEEILRLKKQPNISGKNYILLMSNIELQRNNNTGFNEEQKLAKQKFYEEYDSSIGVGQTYLQNSGEFQKQVKKHKNIIDSISNAKSTGEVFNIITGSAVTRTALPFLIVGFAFGMFGNKHKFTDSWWKRLIIILGAPMLYGAVKQDLGVTTGGEIIDNMVSGVKSGAESIGHSQAYQKSKENVQNLFKKENFSGNFFSKHWNTGKEFIGESFDKVNDGVVSYNETLKGKDGKPKDGYIEEEKLIGMRDILFGDLTFLNTHKGKLLQINNFTALYSYVSDSNKAKLAGLGISDKDISNFIQKHILANSFKEGDEFVKDIFKSTQLKQWWESLFEEGSYFENPKLNRIVRDDLSPLLTSQDSNIQNVGRELQKAILSGEISKFNIDNFTGLSNETKKKIEDILAKIIIFKELNKDLVSLKKEINELKPIETTDKVSETKESLEEKLNVLEEKKERLRSTFDGSFNLLNENNISSEAFGITEIETFIYETELELWRKAKGLSIPILEVGSKNINVVSQVSTLEGKKEFEDEKKMISKLGSKLEKFSLEEKSSLEDFSKYITGNKEIFKQTKRVSDKYANAREGTEEERLKNEANQILATYEKFKNKFNTKIVGIKREAEKFNTEVNGILTSTNNDSEFISKMTEINLKVKEYDKFKEFREFDFTVFGAIFKEIDGSYNLPNAIIETTKLLSSIDSDLKTKTKNLKNNFDISVISFNGKTVDVNGSNNDWVTNVVDEITGKRRIIEQFNAINFYKFSIGWKVIDFFNPNSLKASKEADINSKINELVKKYVDAIDNAKNIDDLNSIVSDFEQKVRNPLGLEKPNDKIKTALNEKVMSLFESDINSANLGAIEKIPGNYGLTDDSELNLFDEVYDIDSDVYKEKFVKTAKRIIEIDDIPEYQKFYNKYNQKLVSSGLDFGTFIIQYSNNNSSLINFNNSFQQLLLLKTDNIFLSTDEIKTEYNSLVGNLQENANEYIKTTFLK